MVDNLSYKKLIYYAGFRLSCLLQIYVNKCYDITQFIGCCPFINLGSAPCDTLLTT